MDNIYSRRILVTGAGGFIGHHLVKHLKSFGYWVRGVDIKYPEYEASSADEFIIADLRFFEHCLRAVQGVSDVYHLAADMGGIGYITANLAELSRNNVLINSNMLEAARYGQVQRYLYTSSACVYPAYLQDEADLTPLAEHQAIPADPERGYGWEKLFTEQLTEYYQHDFGLDVRIVRFHNIYGPLGTYDGGKEKAPAAICRKVAQAPDETSIEVWGDGNQTRSFCYIDDCVQGIVRIMDSTYTKPINLGTEEMVTINQLVDLACEVAGKRLIKNHDLSRPQGVRGRNSDNALLRELLNWEPRITLREGMERTYSWIWGELDQQGCAAMPAPNPLGRYALAH